MMRLLLLIPAIFALAACAAGGGVGATLTPAQCATDWAGVGEADGRDGARPGKLDGYIAACARGGSALSDSDIADWRDGWRRGVATLCTADESELGARAAEARSGLCDVDVAKAERSGAGETAQVPDDDRRDHAHRGHGPYVYPSFGFGIGFGSYGTRFGSRFGIGIGFPFHHHRHRRY